MKKIYIILIVVIVLSSSGIGIYAWSKKKKDKAKKAEEEEPTVVEKPALVENPVPIEEKPLESALNSEIPKELITDISIDYVDANRRELGYSMHYKGISHEGTFKEGDKDVFVVKPSASFAVVQPSGMKEEIAQTKEGKLNSKVDKDKSITAADYYNNSFVYLAIYNKKQLVTGMKVNLQSGEQIEGLPTEWAQLEE